MKPVTQPHLRCAIYTRVSTDYGLEQEFNSLDNQREAAEAYIKSQAHEGWRCLPAQYDDGGFSGGSLERPALQQLLSDIRSHLTDVVVVYKVDRLTRSLADFAKLVELFDAHGVSFVSVTQAFNTTTSMGRLTLNVLLSFAQFEREVTGERIRDKIAASKKKGIWMGGVVPLGYRVQDRALHVLDEHAAIVRLIFGEYLRLGSVGALQKELEARGVILPVRIDGAGRQTGGKPFSRGHLYKLLANPVYLGEITHKGKRYAGQHEPVIDRATWDRVQEKLASLMHAAKHRRRSSDALLLGRVFDDRGHPMSPSYAQKGGIRYRYYVSQALLQGRRDEAGSRPRMPAPELEQLVTGKIKELSQSDGHPSAGANDLTEEPTAATVELIERIVVRQGSIDIIIRPDPSQPAAQTVTTVAWERPSHPRRRQVISPEGSRARPIRAEARAKALEGIALGRVWLDELVSGRVVNTAAIAEREGCSERSVRLRLSLAFLSPKIVAAIVAGTAARGVGLSGLTELSASWIEQERAVEVESIA